MPYRIATGMKPEKRESGSPARAHVALHRGPADGIGAIEDDDPFPRTRCIAHQLDGRRDVGVVAGADVLQVDQEHVD